MRRIAALLLLVVGLPLGTSACLPAGPTGCPSTPAPGPGTDPTSTVLVFSRTTGFRHDSIATGIARLQAIATSAGWTVDATEDPCAFNDTRLDSYGAVVFLLTTGDVLDDAQQAALERFVTDGGGWVGIHSAADTEAGWPWYGQLLGTRFTGHPPIQSASLTVEDPAHVSTAHLTTSPFTRADEWYNFAPNPRPSVHVLLTIDEASYDEGDGNPAVADHPIAWCHDVGNGRAWYTAGGHTVSSYAEPDFAQHLRGGLAYALDVGGTC